MSYMSKKVSKRSYTRPSSGRYQKKSKQSHSSKKEEAQQKALAKRNYAMFEYNYSFTAAKNSALTWALADTQCRGLTETDFTADYHIIRTKPGAAAWERTGNSIFVKKLRFKGFLRRPSIKLTGSNTAHNYNVRLILALMDSALPNPASAGDHVMEAVRNVQQNTSTFRTENYLSDVKVYYDELFDLSYKLGLSNTSGTGGASDTDREMGEVLVPVSFSVDINKTFTFDPVGDTPLNQNLVLYAQQNTPYNTMTDTSLEGVVKFTFDP